ncbi:MAG: D-amino acid aminotransferase [Chromatiaceae bacterium]|jgi:D-alanine transaminase|nr:D-amino acid aminotransferase [Chromatiaceae bacterium]
MAEVYLNGEYLPLSEARISVLDRGFLFGDGVYEVIPVYGGRPLRLPQHLDRLENSLRGIRLDNPLDRGQWGAVIERLLAAAPGTDQAIYLQVTRGAPPERDHLFPVGVAPTVLVMAKPLKPRAPQIAERGVSAVTLEDLRWLRCDIKAVTLLANVLLRQASADAGADEAILVRDGLAQEGSSSNLFLVKDGVIHTPPKGQLLLAGITRDLALDLAREAGLPCVERPLPVAELATADEVWLSSSTREVMPVTRLDGAAVGDGLPGPVWRRLDTVYQDYKARLRRGDV